MQLIALVAVLLITTTEARADLHPCASDARDQAQALLGFHLGDPDIGPVMIGDTVTEMPSVRALKGDGRFDVLEVRGFVLRAEYRMRFLFAQIGGTCVLMGQEILEDGDPY